MLTSGLTINVRLSSSLRRTLHAWRKCTRRWQTTNARSWIHASNYICLIHPTFHRLISIGDLLLHLPPCDIGLGTNHPRLCQMDQAKNLISLRLNQRANTRWIKHPWQRPHCHLSTSAKHRWTLKTMVPQHPRAPLLKNHALTRQNRRGQPRLDRQVSTIDTVICS